jgi:hypothetical protein
MSDTLPCWAKLTSSETAHKYKIRVFLNTNSMIYLFLPIFPSQTSLKFRIGMMGNISQTVGVLLTSNRLPEENQPFFTDRV